MGVGNFAKVKRIKASNLDLLLIIIIIIIIIIVVGNKRKVWP